MSKTRFMMAIGPLLVLCACSPEPRPRPRSSAVLVPELVAGAIVDKSLRSGCGADIADALPESSTAVFMTAAHCLGCADIGYFMRRLERDTSSTGPLRVFTPETHVMRVCEYFEQERLTASVIGLPDSAFAELQATNEVVVARIVNGEVAQVVGGFDGRSLLELLMPKH